jgi:hypothetical protein
VDADRKALRRQYKETIRPAGVFAVRNIVEDVLLIGTSPDLPGMLNRQRFQLDMGAHPSKRLLADWKRLGPDAFSFDVLDRLEASEDPDRDLKRDLATLRDMWLTKLAAEGQSLYTDNPVSG